MVTSFPGSMLPRRSIQSFVRREGRMTKSQQQAFETLWPIYGLPLSTQGYYSLHTLFARHADTVIEIGFGDGQSLIQMAKAAPEKNFIGIEVYRTGIGSLLASIQKEELSNIRVFHADAIEVLDTSIPDGSIHTLQLFFADPWPKVKHHKRRLVQTHFIEIAARKLESGGILHMATDWEDYALHMRTVMDSAVAFKNSAGSGQFMPRPDFRPLTKYEKKGLKLGHGTWDLMYQRL